MVFTDVQAPAASQTQDGFERLKKALGVADPAPGGTVDLELDGVGASPARWTSPTNTSWAC
ncbi:hypothetical protein QFZ79_000561 [Arthrobacter sp. V4I6]|uniref:hypothetical protein n=1 Tax=unclassified Arthrobacter TaxID=235627 RepID=UPI00277F1ED3|nr:hypothetical protein [Arthrobacter sp. V1I7]MDQ0852450.1 hypothetical protein [Arthrobacter sp. V4I6]